MTYPSFCRTLSILLCSAILASPMACATSPSSAAPRQVKGHIPHNQTNEHVPHDVLIIAISTIPEVKLRKPWGSLKGTAIGVGRGALKALDEVIVIFPNTSSYPEVDFIIFTVLYTFAGPAYMIEGGFDYAQKSLPRQEIEQAASAIANVLQNADIQTRLRDKTFTFLFESVSGLNVSKFNALPEEGPQSLQGLGYDTVLELSVTQAGLSGGDGADPPLSFILSARTRVISTESNTLISEEYYSYTGKEMTFAEWAEENAEELRQELDTALTYVAKQAAENTFHIPLEAPSEDFASQGTASN